MESVYIVQGSAGEYDGYHEWKAIDSMARDIFDEIIYLTTSNRIKKMMRDTINRGLSRKSCCAMILSKYKTDVSLQLSTLSKLEIASNV